MCWTAFTDPTICLLLCKCIISAHHLGGIHTFPCHLRALILVSVERFAHKLSNLLVIFNLTVIRGHWWVMGPYKQCANFIRDEWVLSDKWTCLSVIPQHISTWSSFRFLSYCVPWALLNYILFRFRYCTCIGFDNVTVGSLYFKCCFRLKRRNMSALVFAAWQTVLGSPCQSVLPNAPCSGKGQCLLKDTLVWALWLLLCVRFLH